MSMPVVLSTSRRHFSFFLRTKSDGAIVDNSCQLMSAADRSNKPLAVVRKAESGTMQLESRMKNEQGISDATLKRRNFKHLERNSTKDVTSDEVVAKSVRSEYRHSAESSNSRLKVPTPNKNNDHNWPANISPALESPEKSNDSFRPMSTICRNGSFAGPSEKTSIASELLMQEVPMAGQPNVNTPKITYCTAVPLATSNIVNISRPCSVTGQNSAGIHRRVIVIKRRQNLPTA